MNLRRYQQYIMYSYRYASYLPPLAICPGAFTHLLTSPLPRRNPPTKTSCCGERHYNKPPLVEEGWTILAGSSLTAQSYETSIMTKTNMNSSSFIMELWTSIAPRNCRGVKVRQTAGLEAVSTCNQSTEGRFAQCAKWPWWWWQSFLLQNQHNLKLCQTEFLMYWKNEELLRCGKLGVQQVTIIGLRN